MAIFAVSFLPQLAADKSPAPRDDTGRATSPWKVVAGQKALFINLEWGAGRDDKEGSGVFHSGSVTGIPDLKSETWGTLGFVAEGTNSRDAILARGHWPYPG